MTAIAREQFRIQGPVVRHLPTGARFTKGSNVIDWGRAGDRLTSGEQYPRREVMHTALQILDEIADTVGRGPPTAHRRLLPRKPGEALTAGTLPSEPEGDEIAGEGDVEKKPRPLTGWRRLSKQLVIAPLCAIALGVWAAELASGLTLLDAISAYLSPPPPNPFAVTNIPCCGQWYVLR
jgi:hypothetical protein